MSAAQLEPFPHANKITKNLGPPNFLNVILSAPVIPFELCRYTWMGPPIQASEGYNITKIQSKKAKPKRQNPKIQTCQ